MRRFLRIAARIGMGLSALLFLATALLWARSLGHREEWTLSRFVPDPPSTTGQPAQNAEQGAEQATGQGSAGGQRGQRREGGQGGRSTVRQDSLTLVRGKLWLGRAIWTPVLPDEFLAQHQRQRITADAAQAEFDSVFRQKPWSSSAWHGGHFAGAAWCHVWGPFPHSQPPVRFEVRALALPFWMPALLFALWPALFTARRLLRRKRYPPGHCLHCGYDLRATPDRCPECGRVAQRGTGV